MPTTKTRRPRTRPRRISDDFAERMQTIDDVVDLRAELVEQGSTPAVASSVVGWLLDLKHGRETASRPVRLRWEALLEACTLPPERGPRGGRRDLSSANTTLNLFDMIHKIDDDFRRTGLINRDARWQPYIADPDDRAWFIDRLDAFEREHFELTGQWITVEPDSTGAPIILDPSVWPVLGWVEAVAA